MENSNLLKIMSLKPETLAQNQHDSLKEYAKSILQSVLELTEEESYNEILDNKKDLIRFSPDGDGYGSENHFINFDYGGNVEDIYEIIYELRRLKEMSKTN